MDEQADILSYVPRIAREWAETPERKHRLIEGSLLFADLTGFTSMTERLAALGRRGAEEVSAIISETFELMLIEAYRAGGSLLKFGGDALLLLFEDADHHRDAAWGAWGMRNALRSAGRFETPVGRVRLGMTTAVASGPIHAFMAGDDQRELLVAGGTVSELMRLERRAQAGQTLLSQATAARLPEAVLRTTDGGERMLARRPPEVPVRSPAAPVPARSVDVFVPAAVRHRLAAGEATLEHRHIAIGFVGIGGLDDLIRDDPQLAADSLDRIVGDTSRAAAENGAWLLASDVAADGAKLIVTAGAPVATGRDEAALLHTLSAMLTSEVPLELRLGANHGTVFFGDIGPDYRRTLTVMGDTVNTAARLMGAASPGVILTASSMLAARGVDFTSLDERQISLRGKQETLSVTEVSGPAGAGSRGDAGTLIGRDRELGRFRRLVSGVGTEGGLVVEVVGAPGSGRSRFLDLALDDPGIRWVRTEANLNERAVPYAVVRRLFEQITGIDIEDQASAGRLRAHVEVNAPGLLTDLPFAARALGVSGFEETVLSTVDARFVPAITATALTSLLASAEPGPLLVAVDDVHLADATSLEVLRQLGSRIGRLGWVLCVTANEAGQVAWSGARVESVRLGPLDPSDATALIESLTEDDPVSNHELQLILSRAEGNPLAIREILSARRSGMSLDSLPAAVEGLAAMRIDQLPGERRRQLELAAVLGDVFDMDLYRELAGEERTLTTWDDGFLEARETHRVRFTNPVIRDVLYNRLPFSRRIGLHRSVADALDRRTAPVDERAGHLVRGERWAEGYEAAMQAGEMAERRFANIEAIHWYESALECSRHLSVAESERSRLWFRLGELRERSGQYGGAHLAFRNAEKMTDSSEERARVLIRRSRMLEQLGSYRSALGALTRARKLAPETPDVVAAAIARYGGIRFLQGRHQEARRLAQQALQHTNGPSTRSARGLALMILDMARTASGEPIDGSASREALAIFEEQGELARQARVTNNLGMFAFFRGEWNEAARLYSESRATFERIGDEVNASYGANNLAEIWALQGRYVEAEELFREVRRIWRAADDRYGAAYIEGQLGLMAGYAGRLEEAETRIKRSIEQFEALGARAEIQEAGVHLLELKVLACDRAGASEIVDAFGLEEGLDPRLSRLLATHAWQVGAADADRRVETALKAAFEAGSAVDELRLQELSARAGYPFHDSDRRRRLTEELGMVVSPVYPGRPASVS